jgi:hypothetical protein
MALNRPDVFLGVAFNADPFDVQATPSWTDLTSRIETINSAKRGRQYELDRNQTGNLDATWLDIDEALNPANTGSPYYPNVVPYRAILARCMWPNGGTGNLLNLAYNGTDASFESYTAAAAAPSWLTPVSGGENPVISTTNPQQGTKCVQYGVGSSAVVQGLSWVVPCIPGRQYTASAYLRQTSASTQQIKVVGGATGSSTTTTSAYVRLTVTFTATQPTHTVQVSTVGTAIGGSINLDALQHEPGASASAFTTTGPMIKNFWTRGYVERWTQQWDDEGFTGQVTTPCVGPLGIVANADLHTEIDGAIRAKVPTNYWTLQEPNGATVFADTSGNNGPPLLKTNSPVGAGPTFAPGTATGVAGDNGGVGVRTAPTPGDEGFLNKAFTCLQLGYTGPTLVGPSAVSGSDTTWAASCAFIMTRPANAISNVQFVRFTDYNNTSPVGLTGSAGSITPRVGGPSSTDIWGDGKPHLYVITSTMAAPDCITRLWIDGVLISTSSAGGFPVGLTSKVLALNVGGSCTYTFNQAGQDQTTSRIAYWNNRALSSGEVADLAAAFLGYAGETAGPRIARYLGLAGYTGPTSLQAGASTLTAASVKEGDSALDTCQYVGDTEFGNLYESQDGITFAGRFDRYLKTASTFTFGENVAGGEYPYEGDIQYDTDPTLVLNVADVTQTGGVKIHAEDPSGVSQKRYGKKPFTRTVDLASANEVYDAATWVVANRKAPSQRVASVTFNPAAVRNLPFGDGTLWPMLLQLEIGTRVTVKRRPKAANAGAGITMSGDFFVESIDHHDIDFEAGTWSTTVELSPVNIAQPWILGDATYGQLDSTTVLGF